LAYFPQQLCSNRQGSSDLRHHQQGSIFHVQACGEDNQIALPFGGLIMKILKKNLSNIPANELVDMPKGIFGKGTVMKSNA
jgi:hypothetical protein